MLLSGLAANQTPRINPVVRRRRLRRLAPSFILNLAAVLNVDTILAVHRLLVRLKVIVSPGTQCPMPGVPAMPGVKTHLLTGCKVLHTMLTHFHYPRVRIQMLRCVQCACADSHMPAGMQMEHPIIFPEYCNEIRHQRCRKFFEISLKRSLVEGINEGFSLCH